MSDDEDYNSEEDVDYVPSEGEQVSEEENSGDEEDLTALQDDPTEVVAQPKKKAPKKGSLIAARKRRGGIKLDASSEDASAEDLVKQDTQLSEEEEKRRKELAEQAALEEKERQKEREKKRADDLWSSFMADVKPARKNVAAASPAAPSAGLGSLSTKTVEKKSDTDKEQKEKSGKVKITKVFDFAGEEIKITKEVDADSKEAKAEQRKQEKTTVEASSTAKVLSVPTISLNDSKANLLKRPAVGGLSSVLSKIGKKDKMGTLEKSRLDWNSFKQKEGIEEDLKIHNKGKHGYTERMAFLNRADQRQFELERDLRLGTSSKR